jgi:hypothetical protein
MSVIGRISRITGSVIAQNSQRMRCLRRAGEMNFAPTNMAHAFDGEAVDGEAVVVGWGRKRLGVVAEPWGL